MKPDIASISEFALDPEEEKAVHRFMGSGPAVPPPFSTSTMTASQFRWSIARKGLLQAFAVTGLLFPLGLYGIVHVFRRADSMDEFWKTLIAEKAHWGALALFGLHALIMLLAYAVQGGFRSVAFASEPLSLEGTADGLSASGAAGTLSGPWTHWRLGQLVCSAVPDDYPMVALDSFWLLNYDTRTGAERGRVHVTPDEMLRGSKVCARLLRAMCAASEVRP